MTNTDLEIAKRLWAETEEEYVLQDIRVGQLEAMYVDTTDAIALLANLHAVLRLRRIRVRDLTERLRH
ncbi:hypothetical protein [Acuticoccus sediminis]|uniref:hypothetical protein n=1 Tax=Acuticoccus sediminis TaxID=2184697 RepID=UPI0011B94B48|nr:hypothetical protein [Acuticoccus sediminis]